MVSRLSVGHVSGSTQGATFYGVKEKEELVTKGVMRGFCLDWQA